MLHKLQTNFLKGIYDTSYESEVYNFIQESGHKTAEDLLAIYRGSIFGGLKKALSETFPVTKELVGEEFFNMMLGQFIKEHPCKVQDLNDYGESLPIFIQNLRQAKSVPYLAAVSELEWFYNICLNSEIENNNLDNLSLLREEQQENIKFNFPNGASLLCAIYPVDLIWNAHVNSIEKKIDLKGESVYLIIIKNGTDVEIHRLSEKQFCFLNKIKNETSFANACFEFSNDYSDTNVNEVLIDAIEQGWIRSFSIL